MSPAVAAPRGRASGPCRCAGQPLGGWQPRLRCSPSGGRCQLFERFTDQARQVVVRAQEEAGALHHNYIGTEHILLGLIGEREGVAAEALESLGISLEGVRSQVEEIIGRGQAEPSGHIPFTPRAKKVLELSLRESVKLGHRYVDTEHLLLGLIREGGGVAAEVLVGLGAELHAVRQKVIELSARRRGSGPTSRGNGRPPAAPPSSNLPPPPARPKPGRSLFNLFTDQGRRVVVLAQEEAGRLAHDHIGTEHLLLGLIGEREGLAAEALESLGISLEGVRSQVEKIIGRGQAEPSGHSPFTPRAKKVLELSLRESLQLGHDYIGTEHILLGLVREGEGLAAQVLVRLGADLNRVRQQVVVLLAKHQ